MSQGVISRDLQEKLRKLEGDMGKSVQSPENVMEDSGKVCRSIRREREQYGGQN